MTDMTSTRIKKLAVGATITFMLGGGATALLVPTFASATIANKGVDDPAGHAKQGADDPAGHAKQGADDVVGHG